MVLWNHHCSRRSRTPLPQPLDAFLEQYAWREKPKYQEYWPRYKKTATVLGARVLGCPMTVGYTCKDECFEVLKIAILTVNLDSSERLAETRVIFLVDDAGMVCAPEAVVQPAASITDGSIDEILNWPVIRHALHLLACQGKGNQKTKCAEASFKALAKNPGRSGPRIVLVRTDVAYVLIVWAGR